jgi:hypothetical protein
MNIVITGGYGTLGIRVAKRLVEEDHNVYIADPQGLQGLSSPDPFNPNKELPFENYGEFLCPYSFMVETSLLKGDYPKPDVVIHLAEDLNTTNIYDPISISTNINQSAEILYYCISNNIQCIYPMWIFKPPITSSILALSLHSKSMIPSFYKVANALIKTIELPIFIDLNIPASNLFSLLSKVYNWYAHGMGIIIREYEYFEDVSLTWTTTEIAANKIVELVKEPRGRSHTLLDPPYIEIYNQRKVIGTLLDILNMDTVLMLQGKQNPIEINRYTDDTRKIRQWISASIAEIDKG